MRRFIAGAFVAGILFLLGVGLLPPVLQRGSLNSATHAAASAGSAALASGAGISAADSAALASISRDRDISIVSMGPVPDSTVTFAVTTQEHVHTFMNRFSFLKSWFVVTSTQVAAPQS